MNNGLEGLFTLLDPPAAGASNASVRVRIDADHALFNGHFPERPVLPGVVMAHIATRIISRMAGMPMRIATSRAIKFLSPVDPHLSPELIYQVDLREAEGATMAEVKVMAGEVVVMKLSASVIRDER